MVTPVEPNLSPHDTNQSRQATSELENALSVGEKTTKFPSNIQEVDHWMAFRINEHEFRKKDDYAVKNDLHRVFLPLPEQLATAYGQSYSSTGIGNMGELGSMAGADLGQIARGNASAGITSLVNKVTSGVSAAADVAAKAFDQATNFTTQGFEDAFRTIVTSRGGELGLSSAIAFGEAIPGIGNAVRGAQGAAGLARNPFLAMLYEGPSLREHHFSWKLVAKSYDESLAIYRIIKLFKYYAAPQRSEGGFLFDYPQQFDVDFHHDEFLYNIGPSVVTNIQVNYHPDGVLYHHQPSTDKNKNGQSISNGAAVDISPDIPGSSTTSLTTESRFPSSKPKKLPVSVQLSINLQEVGVVTKDEINNYNR